MQFLFHLLLEFLKPLFFTKALSVVANMTSVNRLEPHHNHRCNGAGFHIQRVVIALTRLPGPEQQSGMLFQYALPQHRGLWGRARAFQIELNTKDFILKSCRGAFAPDEVSLWGIFIFSFGFFSTFFKFADMRIYYFRYHLFENQLLKNEISSWDPAIKRVNFYSEKYIKCSISCDHHKPIFIK